MRRGILCGGAERRAASKGGRWPKLFGSALLKVVAATALLKQSNSTVSVHNRVCISNHY